MNFTSFSKQFLFQGFLQKLVRIFLLDNHVWIFVCKRLPMGVKTHRTLFYLLTWLVVAELVNWLLLKGAFSSSIGTFRNICLIVVIRRTNWSSVICLSVFMVGDHFCWANCGLAFHSFSYINDIYEFFSDVVLMLFARHIGAQPVAFVHILNWVNPWQLFCLRCWKFQIF